MRTNVIYAADYSKPAFFDTGKIKDIAPTWGSWKTRAGLDTDNVVCNNLSNARELMQRSIHESCNLFVPRTFYAKLSRPTRLNYYDGNFKDDAWNIEDIIAMHLVKPNSDLVLLFGFDFSTLPAPKDQTEEHQKKTRAGMLRSCLHNHPDVQWVLIDHDKPLDPAFTDLTNITCDSWDNVIKLMLN